MATGSVDPPEAFEENPGIFLPLTSNLDDISRSQELRHTSLMTLN